MILSDFFQLSETKAQTHSWTLVSHDPAVSPVDALAKALAERIMEHLCRGCPQHYRAWRQCADDGTPPSSTSRAALNALIKSIFGLPENPEAVPLDHLEGTVSELLWYFLCLEAPTEEIVRVEPPGFKSTDPGGDALVIHRMPQGYLMFRLWEMKKLVKRRDTSSATVSSTVNTAYNQLNAKATEYLARYTTIGQELPDAELAEFYSKLIEFWVEARPEAAAGVSVTTSVEHIPQRCFTTFSQQFPRFVDPVRLRGMLTAVGDFPAFALKVRESIWTGL